MRNRLSILLMVPFLGAAVSAFAAEGAVSGSAWVPYSVPSSPQAGPARKNAPEPWMTEAPTARETGGMKLKPGSSCGFSEFEVCLDSTGRLNVPGAKRFLPAVPGLKPERLSVRRRGVQFSYSF